MPRHCYFACITFLAHKSSHIICACALHISGRCLQCRLQELQGLFSSVSEEIASREAFMAEMQRCRRPKRDYEHVRLEIADRLQELRKLDAMIAAEAQQQQKAQPQS